MTTRISGVFVPQVLTAQIAAEMDDRSSNLIRSGAVVVDPFLAAAVGQNKGSKVTIPQYASFTAADEVGNDDATDSLMTRGRTSIEVDVPMLRRVINFSAMDLARAEANADPLGDVAVQAASQIIANQNAIIMATLEGIRKDNAANDNNDMYTSIARGTAANSNIADSEKLSRSTIIDAVAQWGDYGNRAAVLVMHSAVYYQLLKDDTTSFAREGEQGFVNTYMGIPVVLDDNVEKTETASGTSSTARKFDGYATYVMGAGALGYASIQGSPVLDRSERVGNGWGQETLIVRRTDLVNPRGISWIGDATSTPANNTSNPLDTRAASSTISALDDATSWDRKWQRKNVPLSIISSSVE